MTRWQDDRGISDLSVAVDEIYALRTLSAQAVEVIDETLTLRSLSAYRKSELAELRTALLAAARGEQPPYIADGKQALAHLGIDDCLTNAQWAEQRGLTPTDTTEAGA